MKGNTLQLGQGLPEQVYQPLPVYDGPIKNVGTLTEAYIKNTESLLTANSRLKTICVAHRVCVEQD